MSFPLYDSLVQQTNPNAIVSSSDVDTFMTTVKEHENIHEIVYAIIRCHQFMHSTIESYILPYNGKKLKKGLKFDFNRLPSELQALLITFTELHLAALGQE